MKISWNSEKNIYLKKTRDITFEDVENAIMSGNIVDIVPHHNQEKYPNQELMIIWMRNYTYYVPFVMGKDEIFLKNIIPSRKYHKKYKKD